MNFVVLEENLCEGRDAMDRNSLTGGFGGARRGAVLMKVVREMGESRD
jgi:hypothetical protein